MNDIIGECVKCGWYGVEQYGVLCCGMVSSCVGGDSVATIYRFDFLLYMHYYKVKYILRYGNALLGLESTSVLAKLR